VQHLHAPGFVRLVADARGRVREATIEDFLARLEAGERFILIDVREESEWAAGHLPGAHHMARGILERDIEQAIPDPEAPIVIYCGGDHRSALAADSLQKLGYGNVTSLEGGWPAWTQRGLPVATPQRSA
jgi:rhodanese-related sulfurtransferase